MFDKHLPRNTKKNHPISVKMASVKCQMLTRLWRKAEGMYINAVTMGNSREVPIVSITISFSLSSFFPKWNSEQKPVHQIYCNGVGLFVAEWMAP